MARTARLVAATTLLALAAPAYAARPLEGRYELVGQLRGGGKYRGEVEIRVEDGEYVLTTRIEGGGSRPTARASRTPDGAGTYRFRYGGTTRGLTGRLGEATGAPAVGPERLLLVRAHAKGLLAQLRVAGKLTARERLTYVGEVEDEPAPEPPASALAVCCDPPTPARFVPLRSDGANTTDVHYRLSPVGAPLSVEVTVTDREGAVVHRARVDEAVDAGDGLTFTWDGRADGRGYVDARRSPYSITITAHRAEESASSEPVSVGVVPLLEAAFVVSRARPGEPLTAANKVVEYDDEVEIVGVVRALVGGARGAGRVHFVATRALPAPKARLTTGEVALVAWDAERWGELELAWQWVQPLGLHSPAYRPTQDAARLTRHGELTNVVSNGEREGSWLGLDTIEYAHVDAGVGSSPVIDVTPGTDRYRFDVDYADPDLRLGEARPGSVGRRDPRPTTATELRSGLLEDGFDPALGGASDRIHRISRKGSSSSPMLAALECFRRVPWLYGSLGDQVTSFIGYDCADLAFGAARLAKVTTRREFTNAHNLCEVYTRAVAGTGVLTIDTDGTLLTNSGEPLALDFGGDPATTLQPGDIAFWDWNGDGKWDHTTIVWDAPSGRLDLTTRLVWAHHESTSTDGFYLGTVYQLAMGSKRAMYRVKLRRF